MNNGDGLRVVLWLSGCSHNCPGCQNPQTWDPSNGIPFDKSAKEELFRELDKDYISGLTLTGGDPLFENNLKDVLDLVTEINKRYNGIQYIGEMKNDKYNILYKKTYEIRLSFPQKSIWLYTGSYWEEIFNPTFTGQSQQWISDYKKQCELRKKIIEKCDVLVDGRYVESKRDVTLKWRGSSNQSVIDIQKSLQQKKVVLWCN